MKTFKWEEVKDILKNERTIKEKQQKIGERIGIYQSAYIDYSIYKMPDGTMKCDADGIGD